MNNDRRPTESLCPVCLQTVSAELRTQGDVVSLCGRCPQHGEWQTPVWVGLPSIDSWCGDEAKCDHRVGTAGEDPGDCPGSCGLCDRHEQYTCTALLEVTHRCDLGCPLCFAESTSDTAEPDPSLASMERMLRELFEAQGAVNLQLSGGEPTVREDLPEIIRTARKIGFTFVQLNTNGLRLASERGYAERLRAAGLASVFLQFDGLSDETYRALRGRPLAAQKSAALDRCAEAGLAVVLVPTVVAGVNEHEVGDLVRLATRWPGVVRGVHLQPVSYFGRFTSTERPRLTLPEVLRLLETQTGSTVRVSDFLPSSCEHVRCSFRARYWVREDGALELVRSNGSCCQSVSEGAARRAVSATSRQWSRRSASQARARRGGAEGASSEDRGSQDGFDQMLDEIDKILCISGMLFQDAWSIDLERVRRCCIHVLAPDRGLVPFCLWNLTSAAGERLYPRAHI